MLTPGLSLSGGAYIEQERFAQFHNPALNEEDATKLTFWENLKAYFNIGSSKEKKEFLNLLWKLHKLNCTDEDVVLELCREITDKVASGNTVKCNGKLVGGTYFYSLTVESDSEGIPVTIYDGYQRYLQNNPTYRDSSVKAGSESLRALENVNVPNILSFDDTFEKNHFTIEAQLRKLKGSLPEFCNAPYGGTNPIAGRQHVDVSASNESKQIAGVEMDSDPCEIDLNKESTLPELLKPRSTHSSTMRFFWYLAKNPDELGRYLKNPDNDVNNRDESGKTILHYAAMTKENGVSFELLCSHPKININIGDNLGKTPVHIATICANISGAEKGPGFSRIVSTAILMGFDCSTPDQLGQTILHIAANGKNGVGESLPTDKRNCSTLLKVLIDNRIFNLSEVLNAVTTSGSTALYHCIENLAFDDAKGLIDAGASPGRFGAGNESKSPLVLIAQLVDNSAREVQGANKKGKDRLIEAKMRKQESIHDMQKHMAQAVLEKADSLLVSLKHLSVFEITNQ